MAKFGGAAKVYASKATKRYYNYFVDDLKAFPSMTDLFHLCASIGMRQEKRTPIEEKDELINVYSIDKDDIFETLLESMLPGESGETRLQVLQEYAETGIRYLHSKQESEHSIDWNQLIKMASK